MSEAARPALLVLASTYPRWQRDHEPGFVHELCKRLTGRFDVHVLTSRSPGSSQHEVMDGVTVTRYAYAPRALETLVYDGGIAANLKRSPWKFALVPGFVAAMFFAARRIVREQQIAIMHAHWLIPQGVVARALARRAEIPFVVTSHGGDLFGLRSGWLTRWKRAVAADATAMTVVSGAMRDEAARLGLRPRRLEVLPMGADMHGRFTPSHTPRSEDELLFVGRLVAKKGLPHLLDAMPEVLRQRPTTRLTIAGFGPGEAELKAQAARLGIAEQVRFLGAVVQADLPALYATAALLVAPFVRDASGDQEGLPVVLMEAVACGCPVLAGDVSGVRDLLGPDADDLCVVPADAARFSAAILATLAAPQAARTRALQLRQAIIERFDWAVIADRYGTLIQDCLAERARKN
jgi:glycosyltransferase involved in cell wall biosynthesis